MQLWSASVGEVNFPGLSPTAIDNMPIGQTTPAAGAFTALQGGSRVGSTVYNTDSQTATIVLTGGDLAGASDEVILGLTGAITTAQNAQLPAVADLVSALDNPVVGQTYKLRVINVAGTSSGAFTLTTNTGWTLHGSMAIAINSWRDFLVTLTSLTAAVLQDVGGNSSVI